MTLYRVCSHYHKTIQLLNLLWLKLKTADNVIPIYNCQITFMLISKLRILALHAFNASKKCLMYICKTQSAL